MIVQVFTAIAYEHAQFYPNVSLSVMLQCFFINVCYLRSLCSCVRVCCLSTLFSSCSLRHRSSRCSLGNRNRRWGSEERGRQRGSLVWRAELKCEKTSFVKWFYLLSSWHDASSTTSHHVENLGETAGRGQADFVKTVVTMYCIYTQM